MTAEKNKKSLFRRILKYISRGIGVVFLILLTKVSWFLSRCLSVY